jgi:hypothetical protein
LTFQHSWLGEFEWLVYSLSQAGGYCKYCTLFPPKDKRINTVGFLVTSPFQKYSRAKDKFGTLVKHAQTKYHQKAVEAAAIVLSVERNPEKSIFCAISQVNQKSWKK